MSEKVYYLGKISCEKCINNDKIFPLASNYAYLIGSEVLITDSDIAEFRISAGDVISLVFGFWPFLWGFLWVVSGLLTAFSLDGGRTTFIFVPIWIILGVVLLVLSRVFKKRRRSKREKCPDEFGHIERIEAIKKRSIFVFNLEGLAKGLIAESGGRLLFELKNTGSNDTIVCVSMAKEQYESIERFRTPNHSAPEDGPRV